MVHVLTFLLRSCALVWLPLIIQYDPVLRCRAPVVLPYYHTGMGDVMPYKARVPRFGHNVTVTFGDPVALDDVTCNCNKKGCDQQKVWQEITNRVRASLVVRCLLPAMCGLHCTDAQESS